MMSKKLFILSVLLIFIFSYEYSFSYTCNPKSLLGASINVESYGDLGCMKDHDDVEGSYIYVGASSPYKYERIFGYDDETDYYMTSNSSIEEQKYALPREKKFVEDGKGYVHEFNYFDGILVYYSIILKGLKSEDVFKHIDKKYPNCTVIIRGFGSKSDNLETSWTGSLKDMLVKFKDIFTDREKYSNELQGKTLQIVIVSQGDDFDVQCIDDSNILGIPKIMYIYKGYKELLEKEKRYTEHVKRKEKEKEQNILDSL